MNTIATEARKDLGQVKPEQARGEESQLWAISTDSGLTLMVQPSLRSISTYVLLEQERWFEPEMSLLPHMLAGGVHALDIGANHGAVALEMARCSGSGHVWAFEPTRQPREALLRSVVHNQLESRVTVVGVALADQAGTAEFEITEHSELNARVGNAVAKATESQRETVQVETLDAALEKLGVDQPIGFVKLDAEGDEVRVLQGGQRFFAEQSPVVLFEFKHVLTPNWPLLDALRALGYGLFRWSAELELILPFDPQTAETTFALNLVALRPEQQRVWAERGLLVTHEALAAEPAPELAQFESHYAAALHCVQLALASQSSQSTAKQSATQRALLMVLARDLLLQATAEDAPLPAWLMLVRCLYALGQPLAALEMASELLRQVPEQQWLTDLDASVPPTLNAQTSLNCTTSRGLWMRQMLREFVALKSTHSSIFEKANPKQWLELLDHPDHSAEVERRFLLTHVRADRLPSKSALDKLVHVRSMRAEVHRNAPLWLGLMQSMRAMG